MYGTSTIGALGRRRRATLCARKMEQAADMEHQVWEFVSSLLTSYAPTSIR